MMIVRLVLAAVVALWSGAAAAEGALDLLDTPASYSADFTLAGPKGTYHGRVWHAKGRERREVETRNGGQAALILRDSDAAWVMGAGGRWHLALSLKAAGVLAGGLDGWQVTKTKVRDESVGGVKATRWKVKAEGPRGGFTGEAWITRDGVVAKASGVLESPDSDDQPVEMVLSNLRMGPVDPAKLEPPQGGFGFDLRKVPPERVEQAIEGIKPLIQGK